ncbi:clathrin light chain B isoform X2 [Pseudoliparis swirei]|uniref:clathrin light chain B isoform X2 n=1 Tax=Pseudoliparis swirei TaxID=2059687 RepID=UPI0024BE8BAE|nr:clathrin light chain B isoform X2 [Pseudoliparis swirei]
MADAGAHPTEEDPAAAFLAQQESEIAGIENDGDGFGSLEEADDGEQTSAPEPEPELKPEPTPASYDALEDEPSTENEDLYQEANGPTDGYAAIAQVDVQRQEPESLRRWREEQKTRLEALDLASKAAEAEWREKAKKELEDWHVHQSDQMGKNKVNNRASEEDSLAEDGGADGPGSEWGRVAHLCDFNPKTSRQAKDVSRMRSVLISLKQAPLVR